ncbi:MAG: nicotinate (nicotinamide) nucleotide adenylyltransferase [Anaerolineaceae bacterium]|nr:nicotinate (nicotinamide) nucleotide adenylyltransferase [Anaerolineaceae bacterium]MCB9101098.1 nicotinate (nicotinamide) nucleotide adenylyltransferase [Anaerolineales bacterium]
MAKIGIIGGTFDPIHSGHLLIAELARDSLNLERVLFVPAGDPPHKQSAAKTAAHHRCRIVELALEDNPAFELSRVDLDRPGPHYSIDTVALIRSQFNLAADDCYFIIGSDSLADLPSWRQPNEFIAACRLAVAHRPEYRPDIATLAEKLPGIGSRLDWVEILLVEYSSSMIRRRIKAGQSVRYQTPANVIDYLYQHQLYR